MTGSIAELTEKVPGCCHATLCNRDRCKVSLHGTPHNRLIVDMDCKALGIDNQTRCDYLFVSEQNRTTWVAPIELKGGKVGSVTRVANQLRGGTVLAAKLLPPSLAFRFVPVLAHKKPIHRRDLKKLRREKIMLRGSLRGIETVRCGDNLNKVLKHDGRCATQRS